MAEYRKEELPQKEKGVRHKQNRGGIVDSAIIIVRWNACVTCRPGEGVSLVGRVEQQPLVDPKKTSSAILLLDIGCYYSLPKAGRLGA